MGFQGPPAADFYSQLSGLGDTLQANAALRQKQAMDEARKGAFSEFTALDPRSPDYGKQSLSIAQKLGSVGDQEGAIKFIGLAQANADRVRQTERDAVADKHMAFTERMAQAAAARANEGPVEKATQREAVLRKYGIDPASPEGRAYAIGGEWSGPGAGGASLNPVFGVGADGKPAMIQPTKTGVAIQTKIPEGFQIAKEPIKVDSGTHFTLLDPQTRQVVGTLPKNLAAVEVEKARGEATGAAEIALPQVIANGNQILKTLTDIEKHPGKNSSVGMYSMLPVLPGTERANFKAAMEQLQGQNFLQAYQTLRGGGAITDIEGKKGENAQARMQTAQTPEAFNAALKDFKDVVQAGILRASAKARGPGAASQTAPQGAAPADGMNRTTSGVPWSVQ